jgi:26S proteasome non-ATPase regulatory subunit 9
LEFISGPLTQVEWADGAPLFQDLELLLPFAFVDEVLANSPAEKAGLLNGDFVIRFGQATHIKHVPEQVAEDVSVVVNVFRVDCSRRNMIDIAITPAQWAGNGLVGAHLVPYRD